MSSFRLHFFYLYVWFNLIPGAYGNHEHSFWGFVFCVCSICIYAEDQLHVTDLFPCLGGVKQTMY